MAYEQRDNSGSLWRNDRKTKDSHPDYTGSAMIGGVDYFMNVWLKQSREGKKFFSFSFKPKNQPGEVVERSATYTGSQNVGTSAAIRGGPMVDDIDDEIPFAPEWR